MDEPTWKDYRLFEFDELVDNATNPPPMIAALLGRPISRDLTEKVMLPAWLVVCCTIHRYERDNFKDNIDLGGES